MNAIILAQVELNQNSIHCFFFLGLVRGDLPRPRVFQGWPGGDLACRKLPGVDIPAATEANILHAAAFMEFKRHVERLAWEGSDLAAYTCWMHGVEVCHLPYVMATGTDSDLLPPLPKMSCCVWKLPALRSPIVMSKSAMNGCRSSGSRQWALARSSGSVHFSWCTWVHSRAGDTWKEDRCAYGRITKSPRTSQLKLGKPINGKQVATAMKDGTKLCPQFQRGGCKAKPCPQGTHRCVAVIRKDRVCGAFNHSATNCNSKRWHTPEEEAAASFGSGGLEPQEGRPLIADLMAGPNAPLTKVHQLRMAMHQCGLVVGPQPWPGWWEEGAIP